MKFTVIAKTGAKQQYVEKVDAKTLKVVVKARPQKGKANEAIVQEVAAFFNVPPSTVSLVHGFTSSHKIIEIIT